MPYYSTDSDEHLVNIGVLRDPLEEYLQDLRDESDWIREEFLYMQDILEDY